jgi:hypothetical protein
LISSFFSYLKSFPFVPQNSVVAKTVLSFDSQTSFWLLARGFFTCVVRDIGPILFYYFRPPLWCWIICVPKRIRYARFRWEAIVVITLKILRSLNPITILTLQFHLWGIIWDLKNKEFELEEVRYGSIISILYLILKGFSSSPHFWKRFERSRIKNFW